MLQVMKWKEIDFLRNLCIFLVNKNQKNKNMKKIRKFFRGAAIICGVLLFPLVFEWMEDGRSHRFQRWFMQDNSFGYNRPWDFGSTGSVVFATLAILAFISFVWILTMDDTEKKWKPIVDTVKSLLSQCHFLLIYKKPL